MNKAFEKLLKRLDDELNQEVLPVRPLVARGLSARLLEMAAANLDKALVARDAQNNQKAAGCGPETHPEGLVQNFYTCDACNTYWDDFWVCSVNDVCPGCGTPDIEPYETEPIV